MKTTLRQTSLILSGALILMMVSLYNGYPLVFSDSGTYILSGFKQFIPFDRPVTYGLFVYLFSLQFSLWLVVFAQNFLTAFLVHEAISLFVSKEKLPTCFTGVMLFLTLFTGIGWYANQIMPDLFTPLCFLLLFLLLYKPDTGFFKLILYSCLLVFSILTHFSHLLILPVLFILILLTELLWLRKKMSSFYEVKTKRFVWVAILLISAEFILPSINYLARKEFVVSHGSHAFMMAHLVDTGLLKKFLKENCEKKEYSDCKLCAYQDSLPADEATFIWSYNGVFDKTGGWKNSKREYEFIIGNMLSTPKYFLLNCYKSFSYGFIQLFKTDLGEGLTPYNKGSAPYGQIYSWFPDELNNYLGSRQNKWNGYYLSFTDLNRVNILLNILSLFMLLALPFNQLWKNLNPASLKFLFFGLLGIVVNSFVTAGLNTPYSRLQARVMWLLPLALLLLVLSNFAQIKKALFRKED